VRGILVSFVFVSLFYSDRRGERWKRRTAVDANHDALAEKWVSLIVADVEAELVGGRGGQGDAKEGSSDETEFELHVDGFGG